MVQNRLAFCPYRVWIVRTIRTSFICESANQSRGYLIFSLIDVRTVLGDDVTCTITVRLQLQGKGGRKKLRKI